MKVLVINAGSSSLKYQLLDPETGHLLAKGLCERIGIDGKFTYKPQVEGKAAVSAADVPMPTHSEAIQAVLSALVDPDNGVISSMKEIDAVGHRVVHGGESFASSVLITDQVMQAVEDCTPLAPLHNPANIIGIEACRAVLGHDVPQAAVFDTAFHQTMPEHAYLYSIPYEYYENDKIRRYGFHGTSHRYVSAEAARFVGKPLEQLKIVTCHIGSGSSISAVRYGEAVDTSMGFTPQEGLPMGTRCGSIDPSIVTYMMKKTGMTPDEMDTALNKKSGLLGVSGVSNDAREVWAAAEAGNARAALAMDVMCQGAKKLIGAYVAEMNGVDVLVFTAGLGENDARAREKIASDLEFLGIRLDKEKNRNMERGVNAVISTDDSPVKVLVIPTDEEYMIAADTMKLVGDR